MSFVPDPAPTDSQQTKEEGVTETEMDGKGWGGGCLFVGVKGCGSSGACCEIAATAGLFVCSPQRQNLHLSFCEITHRRTNISFLFRLLPLLAGPTVTWKSDAGISRKTQFPPNKKASV